MGEDKLIVSDIPSPKEGERPVSVAAAARETGYSKDVIQDRVRRGVLPAWVPRGCERGRKVYVSQLLYIMEGTTC